MNVKNYPPIDWRNEKPDPEYTTDDEKVLANRKKDKEEEAEIKEILERRNKDWEDTVWDLPYKEVMENISKCKTYFSTWDKETWGITAMEALSCGIPVILNCS